MDAVYFLVLSSKGSVLILVVFDSSQFAAPLVPKVRSPGDSSQFQEYEEDHKIFRKVTKSLHEKDFEDF